MLVGLYCALKCRSCLFRSYWRLLFSPLCPWICGLFPAIEFTVAPSSSLPNSGDPGATVARASLNSGDFTATERSGAARSRLFPLVWSPPPDSDRTAQITNNASRTQALTPWPACQRSNPLALGPLGQRALPLYRWLSLTLLSALARSRAHPRPHI
jgi:hypothetical protein